MHGPENEFFRLMQRAAEGDQEAFTQLYHLYNPALLAQLRNRLKKISCLRSLFGPDDLAQEIWIRFFNVVVHQRQFSTPEHILRYLARAARNQIRKVIRNHLIVRKRDARRRRYLSERVAAAAAFIIADPSPTPAWIAEIHDDCECLLRSLTGKQRRVVRMIEAGFTQADIAWALKCSERSIERMVGIIRHELVCA